MKLHTLITLGLAVVTLLAWTPSSVRSWLPVPQATPSESQRSVSITDVRLTSPRSAGDPYRVEATLHHVGVRGPIDLLFRLRSARSGNIAAGPIRARVEAQPGVALVVVAEIQADPDDYVPEVEAEH